MTTVNSPIETATGRALGAHMPTSGGLYKALVSGKIDDTHATGAELFGDAVMGEDLADHWPSAGCSGATGEATVRGRCT